MKNLMLTLIAGALVATATEPQTKNTTYTSAVTAADHAVLARSYRLQAEQLEATAARHAEAAKANPNQIGAPAKWPGLAVNTQSAKANGAAAQARREATEARRLAAHHTQMATEAAFVTPAGATAAGN